MLCVCAHVCAHVPACAHSLHLEGILYWDEVGEEGGRTDRFFLNVFLVQNYAGTQASTDCECRKIQVYTICSLLTQNKVTSAGCWDFRTSPRHQ